MEKVLEGIKWTAGTVGIAIGSFLGGVDGLLYALIVFVAADFVSGIACAFLERRISSSVGGKGIMRKIFIFVLVGIAHLLDTHVLGGTAALRTAVIFFYLANEGISLLENAALLGLPVPEKLKGTLIQIKNKGEDTKDEDLD